MKTDGIDSYFLDHWVNIGQYNGGEAEVVGYYAALYLIKFFKGARDTLLTFPYL